MNDTKISVIIPVYKISLENLRICLDSLVAQTMQDCEFIVVSDGAPEAECSICEEYVARDCRFKFFRRDHAGVSATRNFGMVQAQGEYISFVDSDDRVEPYLFKDAYDFSKKNDSDVTFWNYVFVTPQQMIPQRFSTTGSCVLSEETVASIKENLFFAKEKRWIVFIYPWCKLYKTSLIKNMLFDESLNIGEDRVFNVQVFSKKIRVAYLNRDAYFYRRNESSITHGYFHDAFDSHLRYIRKLEELSNGLYHSEICILILYKFIDSLSHDYFHKDNPLSFKKNLNRLKQVLHSKCFQRVIEECPFFRLKLSHKIDYLFIRFKFIPWLYIRTKFWGLKNRLS
ncbi:MAG: glycosyltransferase [Fibrobacter sp.]|nr:glycosyltransferase [Fibrobacter sp.]